MGNFIGSLTNCAPSCEDFKFTHPLLVYLNFFDTYLGRDGRDGRPGPPGPAGQPGVPGKLILFCVLLCTIFFLGYRAFVPRLS